ncbi:MAG: hypothetical protein GY946_03380 [bacterium]|nr:hypothetical protein [bacterium]
MNGILNEPLEDAKLLDLIDEIALDPEFRLVPGEIPSEGQRDISRASAKSAGGCG